MQLAYRFASKTGDEWWDGIRLAVGCNNITNNGVPLVASSSEDNTDKGTYDLLGRFVYFQMAKKF
jgi:outer membrane receptor protein involved in Fe transport